MYIVYNVDDYFTGSYDSALKVAHRKLSQQGKLIKVECKAVPDTACDRCGEMLFDWQKTVGQGVGEDGESDCYYSIAYGLVCTECANKEAKLEIEESRLTYDEIAKNEQLCHLL